MRRADGPRGTWVRLAAGDKVHLVWGGSGDYLRTNCGKTSSERLRVYGWQHAEDYCRLCCPSGPPST